MMKDIRVLVVDDEKEFAETLSERIRMRELQPDVALNGEEALEKLKQEEDLPDVMILDLKMPGIDGLEVLKKTKEAYPGVQVIMLTAHGDDQVEKEAREIGAFDYMQKPASIDKIVAAVKKAYEYKQKIEKTMMAATFAEAGDFESAKEMSKKDKKK